MEETELYWPAVKTIIDVLRDFGEFIGYKCLLVVKSNGSWGHKWVYIVGKDGVG